MKHTLWQYREVNGKLSVWTGEGLPSFQRKSHKGGYTMKYYLRGCTMEYQLQNVIKPKYRATNKVKTTADGEIQIIEVEMVSENGTSWYPLSALTTELSTDN